MNETGKRMRSFKREIKCDSQIGEEDHWTRQKCKNFVCAG